ncbi:unnamed protein product [Closterium sp. NIES-54]
MWSALPPSSPVHFSSSLVLSSPPQPTTDFDNRVPVDLVDRVIVYLVDRVPVDLIDRGADSLAVLVD